MFIKKKGCLLFLLDVLVPQTHQTGTKEELGDECPTVAPHNLCRLYKAA